MSRFKTLTKPLKTLIFTCSLLTLAACGGGGGGGTPAAGNPGTASNPGGNPNAATITGLTHVGEFYGENARYWEVHAQATCINCSINEIEYLWVVDVNEDGQFDEGTPEELSDSYSAYNVNLPANSDYTHRGKYFIHNQLTYGKPIKLIATHPDIMQPVEVIEDLTADVIELVERTKFEHRIDPPQGLTTSLVRVVNSNIYIENKLGQMPVIFSVTNGVRENQDFPDFITEDVRNIEQLGDTPVFVAQRQDNSRFFFGVDENDPINTAIKNI